MPWLSNLATSKVSILLPRVNLTPALSFPIMLQEPLSSKQSYSSYETIFDAANSLCGNLYASCPPCLPRAATFEEVWALLVIFFLREVFRFNLLILMVYDHNHRLLYFWVYLEYSCCLMTISSFWDSKTYLIFSPP